MRLGGTEPSHAVDVYVRLNRAVQPRASMSLRVTGYPFAADETRGYDGRSRRGNCYTGAAYILEDPAGGLQDIRVGQEVSVDVAVIRRSRRSLLRGRAVVVAGAAGENVADAGEPARYRRLGCSGAGYAMSFPDR